MKNFFYIILAALLAFATFMPQTATGQVCMPDTQYTTTGFYPEVLPGLCNNVPYNEAITVVIPTDTTVNFPPFGVVNLTIDSIVVNNVTDLPTGITYSCNPASCSFAGGTSGCILLSGTPTMSGSYGIDLDIDLYVNFNGSNVVFPAMLIDTIQLNVTPELVATTSSTDADCGVANGTATVMVTSAAPAVSYDWSNGDSTATATGLMGGTYSVAVTDTNGCTRTYNVLVGQAASDLAIDSAASVVGWMGCVETPGGMAAPAVSGTGAPFSYSWSNSTSDSMLMGVGPGTYTVTVTDANGCVEMQTYEIMTPDTLTIAPDGMVTDINCNGESTGAAAVLAAGGDGNLSYSWNSTPVQTTPAATGLPAGFVTATVTDGNGCSKSVDFTLSEPPALTVAANSSDESVAGASDGAVTASASGGIPPYSYSWNGVDTTADLTDLAPGTYDLIVTDSLGCTFTQSLTVMAGNPSSILELEGLVDVKLFPNPNQGSFSLEMELDQPKELEVAVLNMHGQQLIKRTLGFGSVLNERFNLHERGIYLVQVKVGEEIATMKVMVK